MTDRPDRDAPIDGDYPKLGAKVREALRWHDAARRLSVRVAARKTKLSHATIANMARGDRPSLGIVIQFAQGMKVGINEMLEAADYPPLSLAPPEDPLLRLGSEVDYSQIAGIPLSPFLASAGDGSQPPDPGLEYDTFESVLPGQVRAIRVTGDCMEPLYQENDVVFVREQESAENGQKVIAMVDGDKIFCKVYRTNGEAYLAPKNGEGKIPASRFRIIGVIVGVFRKED